MKVFLDTNIFIEYTTCRKQFRWVRDVFDAIEDEIISAVASVGGMYTNAYLVTLYFKEHGIHRPEQTERVRQTLLAFLQLAPTVDCSAETVQEAVNDERFTDIEDSFQYHCALQNDCDVLLTIFFDSPPCVPYYIIIYILLFIDMGWGPCIFRLLTVNLLTLPIFQANSMLLDGELIELGDKKLSLSFFNTFWAS